MKRNLAKRVKGLEQIRSDDLEQAKKEAFLSAALPILIAYHFGNLRPEEISPVEAYERALGGVRSHELLADALRGTLREADVKRLQSLHRQLWLKGRRGTEPYSPEAMEEGIEKMVKELPQTWQTWIKESVHEQLQTGARFLETKRELKEKFGVEV
jgi:hypothetical protein